MKVELPFPSEQNPRDFEIFCEDLLCRAQGFETHPRLAQGPLDLSKRAQIEWQTLIYCLLMIHHHFVLFHRVFMCFRQRSNDSIPFIHKAGGISCIEKWKSQTSGRLCFTSPLSWLLVAFHTEKWNSNFWEVGSHLSEPNTFTVISVPPRFPICISPELCLGSYFFHGYHVP